MDPLLTLMVEQADDDADDDRYGERRGKLAQSDEELDRNSELEDRYARKAADHCGECAAGESCLGGVCTGPSTPDPGATDGSDGADASDGASTLTDPAGTSTSGCAAGGGGFLWLSALAMGMLATRRRRRS